MLRKDDIEIDVVNEIIKSINNVNINDDNENIINVNSKT